MPGSPARKQVRRPPHKAGYNPLPSQPRVGVRRGLQPGSQARRHQRLRCDQATEEVIGAVAVVQGSDTEKSTIDGKEGSGKYVWMDVFARHDGKWQAVRSQFASVK